MKKKSPINKIKYLLVLFIFFSINQIFSQDAKALLTNALTDSSLKQRCIVKPEESHFRLDYDDIYQKDKQAKFLQDLGFHGGGPSWLGILYGAFTLAGSDLINNIDSDVSVTGVSFWSDKKEDLEMISRFIEVIKSDEKILLEVIEIAKQNDMML